MDNLEDEKDLRRALKYEEKKAKQREKRRLGPNGGTGAEGYGLFKKDRLFPQADIPAPSTKLPNEPKAKKNIYCEITRIPNWWLCRKFL